MRLVLSVLVGSLTIGHLGSDRSGAPPPPGAWLVLPPCGRASSRWQLPTALCGNSCVSQQLSAEANCKSPGEGHSAEDVRKLKAFARLKRWLLENGAALDVDGLALKPSCGSRQESQPSVCPTAAQESRGLVASRVYRRGETLISIPARLTFTAEALEELANGVLPGAFAAGEAGPEDASVRLALFLAFFQALQSDHWTTSRCPPAVQSTARRMPLARLLEGWLVYLQLLTPPPATMPMFWTAAELQALEHPLASSVFERHYRLQAILPRFHSLMTRCLPLLKANSEEKLNSSLLLQKLVAAYATAVSRSVRMSDKEKAFVPLVDLCGHSASEPNAKLLLSAASSRAAACRAADEAGEPSGQQASAAANTMETPGREPKKKRDSIVELEAIEEISPGEDVRISYGQFDNPTLLLNYGLLPRNNPHEKIPLEFSPRRVHFALRSVGVDRLRVADDFSFLGPRAVRQLAELGWTGGEGGPVVTISGEGEPDEKLLSAAQVCRAQRSLTARRAQLLRRMRETAVRFIISFLRLALFEDFGVAAPEHLEKPPGEFILEHNNGRLSPGMRMANNFRSSRKTAIRTAIAPKAYGRSPRFVQAKSKLDLMVFITNVFFPSQDPPEYKRKFQKGGCPRWLLDPRKGSVELAKDWLPAAGWSYDVPSQIIQYSGSDEAKEPPHAFPFNLFLPRRASARFALMKRDFFCQGTQIQSTIMLAGANEAGLIFRGVGERNFWTVLLGLGGKIKLFRVKNGEKHQLGTIGDFIVQGQSRGLLFVILLNAAGTHLPPAGGQWYTVNVQELIGDVRVTAALEGKEPVVFSRQQEEEEECRPKNYEDSQGASGLIAGGGPAKFKGTFLAY
ncbi:hypothetical protein Efla_006605 [Eimeria flavescens]